MSFVIFSVGLSLLIRGPLPEPDLESTRLQEENFLVKHRVVMSEISQNKGEGFNIYLINEGKHSVELPLSSWTG